MGKNSWKYPEEYVSRKGYFPLTINHHSCPLAAVTVVSGNVFANTGIIFTIQQLVKNSVPYPIYEDEL